MAEELIQESCEIVCYMCAASKRKRTFSRHKKVQRELAKPHGLERYSINHSGKQLGLDSKRVPENAAINKFAEALALAWKEQ